MSSRRSSLVSTAWLVQAVYYLVTGIWPLLSMRSFQRITGPKMDQWLVKTVGVLVAVIGGVLVLAWQRARITAELMLLAAGSALGLAGIDIVYSLRGRISPIYLLDAVAELLFAAIWFLGCARNDIPFKSKENRK